MVFASPRQYLLLSAAAAVATILLKTLAWRLTGSVGLLSDAMESGVNLIAASSAFWALTLAAKPADRKYHYGHFKAEYFSSGLESVLIMVAALAIIYAAIGRLQQPQPLEQLGIGLVKLTGLTILDPLIAIAVAVAVAVNIVFTGWKLLHETASGLLDHSLPNDEQLLLDNLLASYESDEIRFHALRSRGAGSRRFVSLALKAEGHPAEYPTGRLSAVAAELSLPLGAGKRRFVKDRRGSPSLKARWADLQGRG